MEPPGTLVARPAEPRLDEVVARLGGPLAWLVVPAVALVVHLRPDRLELGVVALVGAALVVAAARRPDLGLLALVGGVPFQLVGLSGLYAAGVPESLVRPLGLWKEAVVAGCVLAAVRAWRASGLGPDALDWAAAGYLGVVGLYYVVPGAFVGPDGAVGATAPARDAMNVAVRTATLFVVLLVAIRHLDLGTGFRDRFARTVFAVGVAVAVLATFELVFSDRWNDLMVGTLRVPRYKLEVLGISSLDPLDIRVYGNVGGAREVRIGSVFLDQLQCGLALVAPFAVGLHRLLRTPRLVAAVGVAAIGVALIGTQTRAALLAALVAGLLVLRPHAGVEPAARARGGALLLAGALALVPVAVGTGLVQRLVGGAAGDGGSARDHLQRSRGAVGALVDQPFGRGLGTGANTATRFEVEGGLLSENYYLLVANETGLVSACFLVGLVLLVARRLGSHRDDGDLLAAAWRGAFVGLALAGLLLYVWESLAVAWTAWIGVGLVLGATRPGAQSPMDSQARRRSGSGSATTSEGKSKRIVTRSPAGS